MNERNRNVGMSCRIPFDLHAQYSNLALVTGESLNRCATEALQYFVTEYPNSEEYEEHVVNLHNKVDDIRSGVGKNARRQRSKAGRCGTDIIPVVFRVPETISVGLGQITFIRQESLNNILVEGLEYYLPRLDKENLRKRVSEHLARIHVAQKALEL